MKIRFQPFILLGVFLCLMTLMSVPAQAQFAQAPVLIRDTEIEETLKDWMTPLLNAAGMQRDSIHLIIVQSPQINAFVAGGANIFVYTGLISKTENPGELIGVLAHELGHIAGSHLISTRAAMERASYESIIGAVLGVGAAIATGEGGAASAIIMGSGNMATRRFLSHTRVNESSADQAALRFMNTAGINPEGLVTFFEKLSSEELLPSDQQSEYMRTHPLTRNRIDAVDKKARESAVFQKPYPESWIRGHERIKAKLIGFISPGQVVWTYNDKDESIPARYARAIAAYRSNQIEPALALMSGLLSEEPDNPYFHELKGQMLVEFGRVKEGLPSYRKAVELLPDAGLIRIAYAQALMESGQDPAILREAISHLERGLRSEPRSGRARRLLATAYGRLGQDAEAKLNLAEEAVLQRNYSYAKAQAEAAQKAAEQGGRTWIQARDLLNFIEHADTGDEAGDRR